MKNFFKIFVVIAFVAVIGFNFTACKNGDDSGDDTGDDGNSGNNGGVINPQGANVYLDDGETLIDSRITAKVMIGIEGYYIDKDNYFFMDGIEIGNITNGKLSFTLPNVSAYAVSGLLLADDFIIGVYTNDEYYTYTVNSDTVECKPQDAKALYGGIYFVYDDKKYYLEYYNETTGMLYLYLDKPTTLKGEFRAYVNSNTQHIDINDTYNCDFKTGWNVVYVAAHGGGGSSGGHSSFYSTSNFSTNLPVNAASMRWIAE